MTAAPAPRRPRTRASRWSIGARVTTYFVGCWAVIAALVPHSIGGPWLVLMVAIATTTPLVWFMVQRGWRAYPSAAFRLFVVRPVLYTMLLLPLTAGASLIGILIGAPFGAAIVGGRVAALVVVGVMSVLFGAGYVGSARLVRRRVDVTVPGLSDEWNGMRIAQISDLHVGPQTSRRFLTRVTEMVTGLAPDLIAITGDLVDDRAEDVAHFAAAVSALRAPLGVYLIPGNHDVYAGWDEVARRLRASLPAATLLVNDARVLTRDGTSLAIVGTGDPAGRARGVRSASAAPDIDLALQSVPPGTPVIALAHNPSLWPDLAERGVALTLSGHTHWGQFALPRLGWSLASPFLSPAMGAHTEGDASLYINPGTGYWGLPFRIGAHPEVTLVTLHAGPRAAISAGLPATRRKLERLALVAE